MQRMDSASPCRLSTCPTQRCRPVIRTVAASTPLQVELSFARRAAGWPPAWPGRAAKSFAGDWTAVAPVAFAAAPAASRAKPCSMRASSGAATGSISPANRANKDSTSGVSACRRRHRQPARPMRRMRLCQGQQHHAASTVETAASSVAPRGTMARHGCACKPAASSSACTLTPGALGW